MTHPSTVASLRLTYRIWHTGRYVDPRDYLADTDLYLKQAFMAFDFAHDGGLLIEVDGKPWNSYETFDSVLNMASWFTGAAVLASGEQRSSDVWAWEESQCRITRLGDDLLRLEDPPLLPPVVVSFRAFLARLLAPGAQLLELQRRAAARIAELCQGLPEGELPAIAHEWAEELPEKDLNGRIARRREPFVERPGWSIDRRWESVTSIPMSVTDLDQLAKDLVALEGSLAGMDG